MEDFSYRTLEVVLNIAAMPEVPKLNIFCQMNYKNIWLNTSKNSSLNSSNPSLLRPSSSFLGFKLPICLKSSQLFSIAFQLKTSSFRSKSWKSQGSTSQPYPWFSLLSQPSRVERWQSAPWSSTPRPSWNTPWPRRLCRSRSSARPCRWGSEHHLVLDGAPVR